MTAVRLILFLAAALMAACAFAQPADSMEILREKLKADKKLVIAANMELTEPEAKNFWPVYEANQKELHKINDQLAMTIVA
jgi:hypothetical protein